jgi:hypothetical protein
LEKYKLFLLESIIVSRRKKRKDRIKIQENTLTLCHYKRLLCEAFIVREKLFFIHKNMEILCLPSLENTPLGYRVERKK